MALAHALPLVGGGGAIAALVALVLELSPMPAALSPAHAGLEGAGTLASCATCHATGGLAQGCLSCHGEIASQLAEKRGYHDFLLGDEAPHCGGCHGEHNGAHFDLVNDVSWGAQVPAAFRHPHVPFGLEGKHDGLACAACHAKELRAALGARPAERERSYLGVTQHCETCHQDPHMDGFSGDCARCHTQAAFGPPHFDHAKRFPLEGGHATQECRACHDLPAEGTARREAPFPFDHTRGKTCDGCHETPHRGLTDRCDRCHAQAEPFWDEALRKVDPALHAQAGRTLDGPHAQVACERCHERSLPVSARYRDASAPAYLRSAETCQGCHTDVHRGQFAGRHDRCLDCHDRHRFQPPAFGLEAHARLYPLENAHRGPACEKCHLRDAEGTRRFAGTAHDCKGCHASPHGPQFREEISSRDCTACHLGDATTFHIRPFDHAARTGVPLEGAHHHVAKCDQCHVVTPMPLDGGTVAVRRYEGTPRLCSQCHQDAHAGQFDLYGAESCNRCHASPWRWKDTRFDHDTQSRFRLEGAHAKVACDRCHIPAATSDGSRVIQYRPLSTECRSCHEIPDANR